MYCGLTPVPDSGFVRRLKEYDSNLFVEFNRVYGKFAIMQKRPAGPPRIVMLVVGGENPAGWRQPDGRELHILGAADFHRGPSLRDRMIRGEQAIVDFHRRQKRNVNDELRDITKDDKYQLLRTYQDAFNTGKGTRPFRPITPKPRGKIFPPRMGMSTNTASHSGRKEIEA